MLCRTLYAIKTSTKMQVDNFILLLFCSIFGVYADIYLHVHCEGNCIYLCYSFRNYPLPEWKFIPFFAWLDSWCDLGRGIPIWFQVLDRIVMYIFPVWGISYICFFKQAYVSCTCPQIILVLSDLKWKYICTYAWMS